MTMRLDLASLADFTFSTDDIERLSISIDRERCAASFPYFVQKAWHILEPVQPLKWGWALDAICDHLRAVHFGDILRLLMNVPPGSMKSLLVNVFFPAWEWGPCARPDHRYIGTAHKELLAVRDNVKCRRLIASDWYQARWPVDLVLDQNAKIKFENVSTGFREAMAFRSMTGSRGSRVLIDDPHSVTDANSRAKLHHGVETFLEAVPSRRENEYSAIIVIMQRLNQYDVSGVILEKELGYVHLCLPMRFEAKRSCHTVIGFSDPRTEEGELMFPDRFPEHDVADLEKTLGSYATAGQLQQRPVPRAGGMFKRDWFTDHILDEAPKMDGIVWRAWDLAATEDGDGARTAGVKMGVSADGRIIVMHAKATRKEGHGVRTYIKETAETDGKAVHISLPQDPGQAGKVQKADFATLLGGYVFKIDIEQGDKETRAEPFSAQCEAGQVWLVRGPWNDEYIDELCMFPGGKLKDLVDASSSAYMRLVTVAQTSTSTTTTQSTM